MASLKVQLLSPSEILNSEKESIPSAVSKTESNPIVSDYITIQSYSWVVDPFHKKLTIPLKGVDKHKIETEFTPTSYKIKFHDVQGKNYCFAREVISGKIVPKKCMIKVKRNEVVINIVVDTGNWFQCLGRCISAISYPPTRGSVP